MVRELTYYEENILNCIMKWEGHADCHNFVVSIREQRQAEVKWGEFAGPKHLLVLTKTVTYEARRTWTPHYEQCDFVIKVKRINTNGFTYLEMSAVSVNATSSDLSFVALNCPNTNVYHPISYQRQHSVPRFVTRLTAVCIRFVKYSSVCRWIDLMALLIIHVIK